MLLGLPFRPGIQKYTRLPHNALKTIAFLPKQKLTKRAGIQAGFAQACPSQIAAWAGGPDLTYGTHTIAFSIPLAEGARHRWGSIVKRVGRPEGVENTT